MKSARTLPGLAAVLGLIVGLGSTLALSPIAGWASTPAEHPQRVYTTQHIDAESLILDGRPDEPAWERVPWSGDFVQRSPYEGEPPSQATEFKVLYDDEALYIAYRAWDQKPDRIENQLARRDYFPGDWVEINIESRGDYCTAFSFTSSVSGVRGDEFISLDGRSWDTNWDPIWESHTAFDDQGWTAEVRIPLSQLRYSGAEEQVWGIQVTRRLFRHEERSVWQFIAQDAPGWVSRFGELRGLRGLRSQRPIELLPYVVARAERFAAEQGNPFLDGRAEDVDAGLDGKLGLTGNLVLDFTVNPDFGQVEADPAEINLSAFETYFSERRPFFIEGSNIFRNRLADAITGGRFRLDNLFYSRRIGRPPQGYPDTGAGEAVDLPHSTTILGAAKLSGKTSHGLSLGILESVTAEERARIDGAGSRREETVEPLTNYFVGRVQQDYRRGATQIGAMLTAVNRNADGKTITFLHRAAYAGGLDLHHQWHDRTHYVLAKGFFSHVRGEPSAIEQTQSSSAHCFQRPDADHVSLDTTRTSLTGHAGSLRLGRRGNGRIRFETGLAWRSPEFEINDLGYMRGADEINQFTWAGYYVDDPLWLFHSFAFNTNQWVNWDFGGGHTSNSFNANTNMTFKNRWSVHAGITRTPDYVSNTSLRGGPSSRWPGDIDLNIQLNSDRRKKISIGLGTYAGIADENAYATHEGWAEVTYRPANAVRLSLNPSYTKTDTDVQYVTEESYGDEARYIFAHMVRETAALTLRIDYCITPNLTVQYYGQPYITASTYDAFRRITDPRAARYTDRFHIFAAGDGPEAEVSYEPDEDAYGVDEDRDGVEDYSFDNPDFNYKEFNSNLVVRWEYWPGSLLYVVWSQGRVGVTGAGDFMLRGDTQDLFDIHPHNVFLIKVSRWFTW
ncbi:MAG: carbohydrate binding family 9 domain-containing protein [Candidatus Eisenbacteria sp.]|nr:carbohydrate binding family 9 domain-containing protein [Candidatus Eisenbacteria bacterium]